jgi:RNA polymerase sigma factor (sigma-70 family)
MVNGLAFMDDWQLLNQYATRNSEEAFRTLVERYAGMVYHTALRQTHTPDAAQEVTQTVFISLAQKAGRVPRQTLLNGWLFRATRFAAWNWMRDEARRRRYEQMNMQSSVQFNDTDSVWEQIAPHLNDALERLSAADREVVLSRFFGNKSHKEVARGLGISEDTAKKRLSRALEKLRVIFARRGVVVPTVVLVAAFSAHGAAAAPAGLTSAVTAAALAKAGAGAASTFTLARTAMKLVAWAKAKTALVVGTGVLLVAAGTMTTVLKSGGTPTDDALGALERQSGKRVVCEKGINFPANLDLKHLSFEQALDQIAVEAYAYWTIDYAVYDSDQSLRQLLGLLHEATDLQGGGWTNLSSRELQPNINLTGADPHGRQRMFLRMRDDQPGEQVTMTVVLGPEAAARMIPPKAALMEGPQVRTGPAPGGAFEKIGEAMRAGVADGVLAPERLLAETSLAVRMRLAAPMPANAATATRLAKEAHARWATIYTLRKSPVEGAGIKLVHAGMERMYPPERPPGDPAAMFNQMQNERFNLTPEDRAAHRRAVEALKQKQAAASP